MAVKAKARPYGWFDDVSRVMDGTYANLPVTVGYEQREAIDGPLVQQCLRFLWHEKFLDQRCNAVFPIECLYNISLGLPRMVLTQFLEDATAGPPTAS